MNATDRQHKECKRQRAIIYETRNSSSGVAVHHKDNFGEKFIEAQFLAPDLKGHRFARLLLMTGVKELVMPNSYD